MLLLLDDNQTLHEVKLRVMEVQRPLRAPCAR